MAKAVQRVFVSMAAAILAGSLFPSSPAWSVRPAYAAPAATTTRYMQTTNGAALYNEGCAQTYQSGTVILDFGQPAFDGTSYGTRVFGSNTFRSVWDIEAAVEQWLNGYWNCGGTGFVKLAIGTSNYFGATGYGHGQAWAQLVSRVQSWIASPPTWESREGARGGSDIELGWSPAGDSRSWIQGFSDVGCCYYYDYGDAAGCPPYGDCQGSWRLEDVWYKSWGALPAYPVPQVYSSSQAQEWYQVALYGYNAHGGAVQILGTLTQWAAAGYCCTNSPDQGWQQLYDALNADWRTAQGIDYSTDITWAG